jgi:hypothetical protein
VIFQGIETWPEGEPLVEIRTEERVIDLHNWASFVGFEYRSPETLILSFDFDESEGGLRHGPHSKQVRLRFDGVSDLQVKRDEFEHSYESDSLSDFIYREIGTERGSVQVAMMDGLTLAFEAGSVVLEEDDEPAKR